MSRGPVALGTLFELPLSDFGSAATGAGETDLTEDALRQLQLAPTAQQEAQADGAAPSGGSSAATAASAAARGPTCIACGIGVGDAPGFASAEEQRAHFSLDWHRYNVKRRAARQPPVSEESFAALVEDERAEVGSISGSESEDSEDEAAAEEQGAASKGATGPQFAFTASGKQAAPIPGLAHLCPASLAILIMFLAACRDDQLFLISCNGHAVRALHVASMRMCVAVVPAGLYVLPVAGHPACPSSSLRRWQALCLLACFSCPRA